MLAKTKSTAELGTLFDVLPEIHSLPIEIAKDQMVTLDCLRLDKIHPFISGNKWYKLKHHLLAALSAGKSQVLSFGGAHSNHLHALAFAANELNLESIGFVRGEAREELTPTLQDCQKWGMKFEWLDRESYRDLASKVQPDTFKDAYPDAWAIPEGGGGPPGNIGHRSTV